MLIGWPPSGVPFPQAHCLAPISSFVSTCAAGLARSAISLNMRKRERDNIITKQKSGGSRDLPGEAHLREIRGHAGGWPAIIWLWSCVSDKRNNWIFFFSPFYLPHCDLIWFHWGLKKEGRVKREEIYSSNFQSHQQRKCNMVWQNSKRNSSLGELYCHVAAALWLHVRPKSDELLKAEFSCGLTGLVLLFCMNAHRLVDNGISGRSTSCNTFFKQGSKCVPPVLSADQNLSC